MKTQLSHVTLGLNPRIQALASSYGINLTESPYVIDWTNTSDNFIFGRIAAADVEKSSVFTFPFLTIDTVRTQDTRRIKFSTYSGPVVVTIDVHHSWPQESILADFASLVDMTEDAVISCLNDQAHQTWPGNLLWNGNIGLQRGNIAMGGTGWIQSAQFIGQFELTV